MNLSLDETNTDGQPKRLHPATLLVRAPQVARSLVNSWPLFVFLVAKGHWLWVALAGVAVLALGFVGLLLHWTRFSYRIDAEEIAIDSGILSRTHRVIPFDRVQDVAIEQGLIARLLGLARVQLETGAAVKSSKEEGELNAVSLVEAELLRDRVRSWRAGHVAGTQPSVEGEAPDETGLPSPPEETPLFAMNLPRVLTAGLFNFSLALFAVLAGLSQTFRNILPFDPFEPETWWAYIDGDSPILTYLMTHRILAVLAGLALVAVMGVASGMARTLRRDYGFRLDRTPTGLRRRRGLTTLTDVIVPIKRVQASVIVSGIIRRLFGWHALKLQSLARDAKEADHDVAPLARLSEIDPILAEVGMTRSPADAPGWQNVHPALWRRWTWLALPLAALVAGVGWWRTDLIGTRIWLALPLIAFWMFARWRAWSHHRFRFDGTQLEITRGWWSRRHIILPRKNIQSIDIEIGPLLRMRGLAALRFGVAGQSALSGHTIAAIPLDRAHALREELLA